MAVKLTEEQFEIVKGMTEYVERVADQVYHIMINHGLNKVEGFNLRLSVSPWLTFTTKQIEIGMGVNCDSGYVMLTKGKDESEYVPTGKNSAEYERLFASEKVRSRMEKIVPGEKPLPPDGLWVSNSRYDSPVGCRREWDINDSLS